MLASLERGMVMRGWMLLAALGVAAAAMPAEADQALSLRRVMLSQGGVGYFEYDATVDGAATLGLDVPLAEVSDALKSLVVLDAAGSVASVELPSADTGAAALAGLPIPRDALNRPLDLLNALQGVTVTVAGPTPMTGRILHAEPPPDAGNAAPGGTEPHPGGDLGKTRVTLLTDAGLQQFVLEDVAAVQVADPALRAKLLAALATLRGSAATARRHLSVRVEGSGLRTVHLGMVVGAPLWKASYRLVLPPEGAGADTNKARLQGWAVLENAGLEDWNGISLTLQSGNPVTFRQAIYQTYYVARPEVPVDTLSHLLPPVDTGASPIPAPAAAAPAPMLRGMAPFSMAASAPPLAAPSVAAEAIQAAAETSFTLPRPLSLAAGQSASVPFIDRDVPASRVDLLAPRATHPLAAIRLVNDTASLLPPGVVTTFDQSGEATSFTGDSRLGPVAAGESRVLSFAEDFSTGAIWHTGQATSVAGVTAARGVLRVTRRERTTTTVDLQAPATAAKHVLVEIPRAGDATLSTEPAVPVRQTATDWRLDVSLAAGEQRSIAAHADRLLSSDIVLGPANAGVLVAVLAEQGLPQAARTALQHIADLQTNAGDREADRKRLQAQRATIDADEARLRANLAAVPATDPLHGQLLRALAADEANLADLAAAQRQADDAANRARQTLADAISSLQL